MNTMRPTTTINCAGCGSPFQKDRREHDRQLRKNPEYTFFCNQSCANENKRRGGGGMNDACMAAARAYWGSHEGSPFTDTLRRVRSRVKRKAYGMDIDKDFLEELWDRQCGRCALTNVPMDIDEHSPLFSKSLDRIDSNLGYTKDNVQWVCRAINLAKGAHSDEELTAWIQAVRESA